MRKELKSSFFWPTKESFEDLKEYIFIAIPCFLMLFFEWTAYELVMIMAGYIDVNSAGACSIILNLFYIFMMMLFGGQIATNVCVGNSLGEGDH
jgi:Na+-driven multidrug efflux pump